MSDLSIEQAIDELRDLVRCRCHPGFTDRGLHDPGCDCDSAEAVEVLVSALPAVQPDAIREAALREAVKALRDWQDNLILCGYTETSITVGMAADVIFALIDKPAKGGDA